MGYLLRFYVPASVNDLTDIDGKPLEEPFLAPQVLIHYGQHCAFIAQIFPISGYDEPSVRHWPLPQNFQLAHNEEPDGIRCNTEGVPLYYVTAGEVAKLELETDEPLPIDVAMMAYIRALPPEHPLIPYVVF